MQGKSPFKTCTVHRVTDLAWPKICIPNSPFPNASSDRPKGYLFSLNFYSLFHYWHLLFLSLFSLHTLSAPLGLKQIRTRRKKSVRRSCVKEWRKKDKLMRAWPVKIRGHFQTLGKVGKEREKKKKETERKNEKERIWFCVQKRTCVRKQGRLIVLQCPKCIKAWTFEWHLRFTQFRIPDVFGNEKE